MKCTHPDHQEGTSCEDRAVSCDKDCMCCNPQRYVGLSLSFCVQAILEKKISKERVAFIVPGFSFDGSIPERYFEIYWKKYPRSEVNEVLASLEFRGLPEGVSPQNIAAGIWWPEEMWDWSVISDPSKRVQTWVICDTRGT